MQRTGTEAWPKFEPQVLQAREAAEERKRVREEERERKEEKMRRSRRCRYMTQ